MNAISQNNGISYGVFSGISTNAQQIAENSENLSQVGAVSSATLSLGNGKADLTQEMIGQMESKNSIEANAQVIQTADSILQTLLDIQA